MAIDARRRAFDPTKSIADVDDGSGGDVVDDSGFGVGGLRGAGAFVTSGALTRLAMNA